MKDDNNQFMSYAINLAKQAEGQTAPNPPVGAILVKNGKIISEGWHKKAGDAHAEVECLKPFSNPKELKDTALFVTLEPCSTYGKTPPCVKRIIESGVRKVIIGAMDPNPIHNGNAIDILKDNGIEVLSGVCKEDAENLIAPFKKLITKKLPFITLKLAVTIDGKISDFNENSRWISCEDSRKEVQKIRKRVDAVMVGANTVRKDNPSLYSKLNNNSCPWRIVIGNNIPKSSNLLNDKYKDKTIVMTGNIKNIVQELAISKNIMHILCEGGGNLSTQLFEAKIVDEVVFFVSPKILGFDGLSSFNFSNLSLKNAKELSFTDLKKIGEDIMIKAKVKN